MSKLATAYLCLGSNLGKRQDNLCQALMMLSEKVKPEKISSVYETEPVGYKQQPLFLNLVCRIATELSARELLRLAKETENIMGRVLGGQRNGPRPMDIDILFYDNTIMKTRNLTLPHPRLKDRAFVLIPLAEIAPEFIHPQLGKSITQLANNVEGQDGVRKYAGGCNVSAFCRGAL